MYVLSVSASNVGLGDGAPDLGVVGVRRPEGVIVGGVSLWCSQCYPAPA